jgi:hypothetical protein
MGYAIDGDDIRSLDATEFECVGIREANIEQWIIQNSSLLGEELLIVDSQYAKFDKVRERPDVLALDPEGKLVVVEIKRDDADETTDLQAIKYASYCSTISAEQLQQDYRAFWNERTPDEDHTPEDVGTEFVEFLNDESIGTSEDGYAEFVLDDQPRIVLVAGGFGPEITTPVIWLEREYGLNISCVELGAFENPEDGSNPDVFVSSRRVLPVPEAEEFMARRREKERRQKGPKPRADRTITALLEADLLSEGDTVEFDRSQLNGMEAEDDNDDDLWRGEVTGKQGRSNNVRWLKDGAEYSFSALAQRIIKQVTGEERVVNGYEYWTQPEHNQTLTQLRGQEIGDIDQR